MCLRAESVRCNNYSSTCSRSRSGGSSSSGSSSSNPQRCVTLLSALMRTSRRRGRVDELRLLSVAGSRHRSSATVLHPGKGAHRLQQFWILLIDCTNGFDQTHQVCLLRVSRPWSSFDGGATWQTLPMNLHRMAGHQDGSNQSHATSPDAGLGSLSRFGCVVDPSVHRNTRGQLPGRAPSPSGSPRRDAARAHSPGYSGYALQLSTAQQKQVSWSVLVDREAGGFSRPWKAGDGAFNVRS
jgi:hypothetical protein